jgi:hypothetical protein
MRRQEGEQYLRNYLSTNLRKDKNLNGKSEISEVLRDSSVKRIIQLCKEKSYKKETLFLAVYIFDVVLS